MASTSKRKPLSSKSSNYGLTSNENINNPQNSSALHHSPFPPTIRNSLKIILSNSWLNWLLIFIPLGYIAHKLNWSDTLVFILNFLAIIPLAKLHEFASEDVCLRVGQTSGGLLNATLGNATESIVSILALIDGQIRVVQASMLGSIISNLLLGLGMCFTAGGIYRDEQDFNQTVAQTSSSLMVLACIGLIIPTAFNFAVENDTSKGDRLEELLNLSHGLALVLLAIYILYLFFQLKTHAHLYNQQGPGEEEEEEKPQLTPTVSLLLLAGVTVVLAFSAEYLVGSIEGIVETSGLIRTFIGLILLPVVGRAADNATAINFASKNKIDVAINTTAGSSMQTALFITPLLVVIGWIIGQDMTLFFHSFETVILFISVLITNYLIQDGKTNWLDGAMLIATYIIISLAFFFYPNDNKFSGKI